MNSIHFHDNYAQGQKEIIEKEIEKGNAQEIRKSSDLLRLSSKRDDRLYSAIGYVVLAETDYANGKLSQATYMFHYAGQVFRSIGMGAKAALVYQMSYKIGKDVYIELIAQKSFSDARKIHKFNLRSAGRSINCFDESGQFGKAVNVRFDFHDLQLVYSLNQNQIFQYAILKIWRTCLGYSLSMGKGIMVFVIAIILNFLFPAPFSLPIMAVGILAVLSVFQRRTF